MPRPLAGRRGHPGLGRPLALTAAAGLAVSAAAPDAGAHPHVWVTVQTTVVYQNGTFAAVRQRWLFDEFYSAQAIEGLDANRDGKLERSELADLAKVNMEGLKEFDYFTFPTLGSQPLKLADAADAVLEHIEVATPPGPQSVTIAGEGAKGAGAGSAAAQPAATPASEKTDGGGFWSRVWGSILGKPPAEASLPKVLALTFTLPFKQPVLAEAEGFEVSTYDPAFFIWFEQAAERPVSVSEGSPPDCKVSERQPQKDAADVQKLGESFFNSGQGAAFGFSTAKSYTIRCKSS